MEIKTYFFCMLFITVLFCNSQSQNKGKISEIISKSYNFYMISKANNFPDIDLKKDSLDKILVLLHYNIPLNEISDFFHLKKDSLQSKINLLQKNSFLKNFNGTYKPNLMVMSVDDRLVMKKQSEKTSAQIVELIESKYNTIKNKYMQIKAFEGIPIDSVSLLLFSNVMLDSWQINNVEKIFLQKPRTERHGKNYYASLEEREINKKLEFIYGNQVIPRSGFSICIYGNNRSSEHAKNQIKIVEKDYLNSLNQNNHKCNFQIIDNLAQSQLSDIALLLTDDLIKIFNNRKEEFVKYYQETKYSEEISFEEYFIWFYHIIYTLATDKLIEKKLIHLPYGNNYFYIGKN